MVSAARRVQASQWSHKCWSQLGRARRLSLPNGKSIRVWWRLLNRPDCLVADRDGFCCCNNAVWLQIQVCCCLGRQIMRALKGSTDPSCCFHANAPMLFPNMNRWKVSQLRDLWLNESRMCLHLDFEFNTFQCTQNERFQLFRWILFIPLW